MNLSRLAELKEKKLVTLERRSEQGFSVCVCSFDPSTGEKTDDQVTHYSFEQLETSIASYQKDIAAMQLLIDEAKKLPALEVKEEVIDEPVSNEEVIEQS